MDVSKLFTNVKNLNEYVSVTQDMSSKYSHTKIRLNMSTVLCLEKIKYLEIEYFNKYHKSGAAFGVLENILRLPPSKTWEVLSKNFVSILKYWFETLKQQIIQNNNNWWIFLLALLKFVKELRTKHPSINNKILDVLGEDLLYLAIHESLSLNQRLETIQCFNICSADSSREIRFALRNKFGQFFTKLSCLMSRCGDFRIQYSMIEALLRWLLPRKELEVRRKAAQEWFPEELYSRGAVEIFLERDWRNFFKDARDFLNAQNETNKLVTSVVCKKMSVGNVELISATDKKYWLDFNIDNKCVSLMLELKLQEVLNARSSVSDALVITEDNTASVKMFMNSQLLKIELTVIDPKLVYNSEVLSNKYDVNIYVKTANVTKVNDSLQKIFENKYKISFDIEKLSNFTQENTRDSSQIENSEDNSRFSNPVQVRRRKRIGVVSSFRNLGDIKSPSTASTSSLALLREKLTALSGCEFEKEPVSVCAHPQLSSVTELSESEENLSSINRHIHNKPRCGKVVSDNFNIPVIPADKPNVSTSRSHDEDSISCLLVATVGSIDEAVLNDTLDRFPKDKAINTDNYIVMRAQEDLQSKSFENNQKDDPVSDFQPEVIEDTPLVQPFTVKTPEINIQQSGVESDTDIVEDTPKDTVTKRKKPVNEDNQLVVSRTSVSVNKDIETQAYDNQAVEQFFSQHFREDRDGQLIISPTLARKVNETSSESDEFVLHVNYNVQDEFGFNQLDIVECLNEMVDKICEDLENYSQYISKETQLQNITDKISSEPDLQTAEETMTKDSKNIEKNNKKKKTKPIKISFVKSPKKKSHKQNKSKKEKKLQLEAVNKMSTIYETSTGAENTDTVKSPESNGKDESLVTRRRRKLYSPKNDLESYANKGAIVLETEDDNTCSEVQKNNNSPKVSAYKEIENIRNSTRKLRNRKCITSTLSPRSKRLNDDFDNLLGKDNNNNEKCIKSNDRNLAIYNFSSDSEDSDFKVKKSVFVSQTDNESVASKRSRRNKPKINYSENKARAKKTRRKSIQNIKESIKITQQNLIDERVRDVPPETLDSSIVIAETEVKEPCEELQPIVAITPRMEMINVESDKPKTKVRAKKTTTKRQKKQYPSKKTSDITAVYPTVEREESISPGLHFEMLPKQNSDDSIVALKTIKNLSGDDSVGKQIDLNITQNMLDEDQDNHDTPPNLITINEYSPHHLIEDMNNNIKTTANDKTKGTKVNKKINKAKKKKAKSSSSESNSFKLVEVEAYIENVSNVAKKPLTRSKQPCEPPIPKLINRNLPNNLDLVQSMNDSSSDISRSSNCISKVKTISNKDIINSIVKSSPSVTVERLSLQEIRKWTPPLHNSVFGSIDSESSRQTRGSLRKEITKTSPKNKATNISSISPIKLFEFTKPNSNNTSIFNSNTKTDNVRYGLRKRKIDDISSIVSSTKRIRESSNESLKKSTFQSRNNSPKNRILESPENSRKGRSQRAPKDFAKKRLFQSPKNRILDSPENSRKNRKRRSPKDVAKKRIFQSPQNRILKSPQDSRKERSLRSPKDVAKKRIFVSPENRVESPEDSRKRRNQTSPKDVANKLILKSPNDTKKRILRSMKSEWQKENLDSSQDSSNRPEIRQETECLVKVLSEGRMSTNSISFDASTTGSVHHWLRRSREAITSQPLHVVQSNTLQDIVNTINEKLEVTLAAIHQNTTDKFKVLHQDAQKQMEKARETRHALYRETATAILNEILEIMDNKFHEMETKCKKIDEELLGNVCISKSYIVKIIADDARRTEELVALLKQDIKRIVNTAPL